MCKYCETALADVDLKYIFQKEIDLGMIGSLEFESYINSNGQMSIEVNKCIKEKDAVYGSPIYHKEIPIKFCPFCGERL